MDVLVTGAAGFIGTHLTRALLRRGDTVTGVDRRPAAGHPGLTQVQVDLTGDSSPGDPSGDAGACWRRLAGRADAVVHLAARPGVRGHGPAVERERARDILGTTEAVLAATPPATPLVVVSSAAVYGHAPPDRGSTETDPLRPVGSYGRWKVAVEARCADRARSGGLVSVARPFTVAGPGQRPDMAVAMWIDAVLADRAVTVFGDLTRSRDLTDVADVVDGLLGLVDAGVGWGMTGTVNLGAGRPRTHHEVLDAIARVTARPVDIVAVPAHPADVAHTWADAGRAADLLGWSPRDDLDHLLRRQVQARDTSLAV